MMRQPHPFARFINILGRGKTLTRSLTLEEAEEAMAHDPRRRGRCPSSSAPS